jgi:hypothetical protein
MVQAVQLVVQATHAHLARLSAAARAMALAVAGLAATPLLMPACCCLYMLEEYSTPDCCIAVVCLLHVQAARRVWPGRRALEQLGPALQLLAAAMTAVVGQAQVLPAAGTSVILEHQPHQMLPLL